MDGVDGRSNEGNIATDAKTIIASSVDVNALVSQLMNGIISCKRK